MLKLKAEDFRWTEKKATIGPLKRQPTIEKHLLSAIVPTLQLLKNGRKRKRTQHKGALGVVRWFDVWSWPSKGYLFPSHRVDAKDTHRVQKHRAQKDWSAQKVVPPASEAKIGRGPKQNQISLREASTDQ